MGELLLFSIPTAAYLALSTRRRGLPLREAASRAGLTLGAPGAYLRALALTPPLLVAAWLALALIPDEVLHAPGVRMAELASASAVTGVVLRAAGEEILFRGLLAGILSRRFGPGPGNLLQALAFLVPHLTLLMVDLRLLPILPVQYVTGWLLGWLRERSGSLLPGAAAHALANVVAPLLA